MDEEVTIIDSKTRNEKIKNFLLKNAKLISFFIIALLLVIMTCLGGKKLKFFLIHSRLCGSDLGSSARGELQIV